jgi:hypothetical protein
MGSFSRFLADDYCTTGKLIKLGFWESQIFWYTTWTGRYAFSFLVSLFGLTGNKIVPILPTIYIILFYFSTIFLFRAVFKQFTIQTPFVFQVFTAVFFVFITLFTLPNIGQDLYWMTGAATYFVPIILGFFLFGLLIQTTDRFSDKNPVSKLLLGFGIFGLAWFNSGFSEIASVLQILILSWVIFYQRFLRSHKQFKPLWITALTGTLIGTMIVIFAPGNAIRQTTYPEHLNLIPLIYKTGLFSVKFTTTWFLKNFHFIWPAFLVLVFFSYAMNKNFFHLPDQTINKIKINTFFLVFGLLFLVFISFLPTTWATSVEPWNRVLIFPTILLVTLFSTSAVLSGFILFDALDPNNNHQGFLSIILLVCWLYFLIAVPIFEARKVYLLKPQAAYFAAQWDERHLDILNQIEQNKTDIKVKMIGYNLMELEHIQADPNHQFNQCAAEFYGVEQISAIH